MMKTRGTVGQATLRAAQKKSSRSASTPSLNRLQVRRKIVRTERAKELGKLPSVPKCSRDKTRAFPEEERWHQAQRQGYRCALCGSFLSESFHAHHIVSHSRGGLTHRSNGGALCAKCNQWLGG